MSVGGLVFANAFFVAAEFALVAVRRSRISTLAESGNPRAVVALRVLDNLDAVISATQFGITLASLALGWIGEETMSHLFEPVFHAIIPASFPATLSAHAFSVAIAFALITFLHIVLGELAPKSIALERAENVALFVARPLELFYHAFKPFIWLLNKSGNAVLRLIGFHGAAGEHQQAYTEEEIRQLVSLSHLSGHLNADERELIHNVFNFTSLSVREVMSPRPTIMSVELGASFDQLVQAFRESGYSRLPVYEKNPDNIIGVVHSKDLFKHIARSKNFTLKSILRKPVFIPDTASLDAALRQLRTAKSPLAFVVDEHGSVEGIVTIEDLLEEIVGEIHDEHDVESEEAVYWPQEDGSVLFDGRISIREANRKLELNLPESDDYATLAGFLMTQAGKLLTQNETIAYQEIVFTVEGVEGRRITRVRMRRAETAENSLAQAETP
ncbi:MAG: hemolysin family protein [Blastocatellia bacterium]|nr:hemolysin family protein [Blastocatellia bacterium]